MRKKIVAGNWKMHGLRYASQLLLQTIKEGATNFSEIEIVIFPSAIYLQLTEDLLANTLIEWGAQNIYMGDSGAFTGEIAAPMLVDYGCRYVLIGHSERRHVFHEDLLLVAAKFKSALEFGLHPVLCVGETHEERLNGKTEEVITQQLESVLQTVSVQLFHQAVIAYEPVWAIGTGLTATPGQAQAVHAFIRTQLAKYDVAVADTVRILYGGSIKADNASALFAMPDIDGGLVGGASLNAQTFLDICRCAESLAEKV